jgi:23S rRNA pseudouridine1911/1915/1917 synthase
VFVNDQHRKCSYRLKLNDTLTRLNLWDEEPDVATHLEALFQDDDILAVSKPAGLPMHESSYFRQKTVVGSLKRQFGEGWYPVHRLDRETSGIVLCGRDGDIRAALAQQFENRTVKKKYLCIVNGVVDFDSCIVDQPLKSYPIPGTSTERPTVAENGSPAKTEFRVLSKLEHFTVLEAVPLTGRTNQIRAHLSYLGFPLLGDKLYHKDPEVFLEYLKSGDTKEVRHMAGWPRHALHASTLDFIHPATGEWIFIEASLPQDMNDMLEQRQAFT